MTLIYAYAKLKIRKVNKLIKNYTMPGGERIRQENYEAQKAQFEGEDIDELARKVAENPEEYPLEFREELVAFISREEAEQKRGAIMARRGFLAMVAAAGTLAAATIVNGLLEEKEDDPSVAPDDEDDVPPEDDSSGETDPIQQNIDEIFIEIDKNDPARIFQNPDTAGGHQSAVNYGHEHFVAYHEGLRDNAEFCDRYKEATGSDFEGINTADEFFAYFKHIARTHTHVIASELIAMKYYDEETGTDFSNMSLRQAEDKILSGDFYDEERLKISEKIDKVYDEKTTFRFIDPPEGTVFKNMGTDVEEYDATRELHGVYVTTSAEELVSDRIGKLLEVATTLPNGTVATRWVNTACSNLLNVIKYTGQDGSENVVVINPDTPATPGSNNPDSPIPSDNPPGENPPEPKDQEEADENSGANSGLVEPEGQDRQGTDEPYEGGYDPGQNTYGASGGQTSIGSETTTSGGGTGTSEGAIGETGQVNDFDAGATVSTGEVPGDTQSADGSGNTIRENLEGATGNPEANPTGDYSQGF
ncbi:hypothetical protein IIY24_02725 [Candidatus Saccharibacteria bacterium]|nr:hypothetical protein [Candidatus Saccharibacteria bacterium]